MNFLSRSRSLIVVMALCLGGGSLPSWAQTAQPLSTATVNRLRNSVSVTLGGTTRPAQVSDILREQDQLTTGASSLAQLVFNDKSLIRLGQNSVFRFANERRQFILTQGVGMMITPRGAGGGAMRTPSAVAAVQGSLVLGIVRPNTPGQPSPNDESTFFAFTSPIELTNPNDPTQKLGDIPVGEVGTVRDGKFLGSVRFDLPSVLESLAMLRGLTTPEQTETPEAKEILAAERRILDQVIPDLTPPDLLPRDRFNLDDLLRDPAQQANPPERDITIIIQ